jgi:hypothetical protein
MTSEELADQVTQCVESLRSRIIGTGDQQYSNGNTQAIELKSNRQLVQETLEELDDTLVYVAVLRTRLALLLEKLQ